MDAAAHEHDDEGSTPAWPSGGPHSTTHDGEAVTPGRGPSLEDLDEFVSLVAHELSTPQAVIACAAETLALLLEKDELDRADIERIADVLLRHSHLSTRLVARLSLAHRIGRGTVKLEPEPLDLSGLVEKIVSDVAAFVLPERTVTVFADSPVHALADRASVSEIVFNLLGNAHKYSPAEAAIEVHVDREERRARVVVRDEGSGVAPGDSEAIFEPYVQTGPNRGGVGLGLYVSRGLARAQGGELWVRPAKDVGSEFVLELLVDAG